MTASAPANTQSILLHASTVDFNGKGVLILGAAGAGKSALALQLMALGAHLVADDRTLVSPEGDSCVARAPETIAGRIEARGVGLLTAEHKPSSRLAVAVNMDVTETERLPEAHVFRHAFIALPSLHKIDAPYFPAAVIQYLKCGRHTPEVAT